MKPPSTGTEDTEHTRGSVSESEYHRLAASRTRRTAMEILAGREVPIALEDLGRKVAVRETELGTPTIHRRDRVVLELHHVHLPIMAEAGVVNYDPELNLVEPREAEGALRAPPNVPTV